jgi:hypothetical protein
MALKIFRKGNYIQVIDTVTNFKSTDSTRNVVVIPDRDPSKPTLYAINSPNIGSVEVLFANIQTEAGAAYSDQAAWDSFWQSNTGGNAPTV